jgi:hypothetical protein
MLQHNGTRLQVEISLSEAHVASQSVFSVSSAADDRYGGMGFFLCLTVFDELLSDGLRLSCFIVLSKPRNDFESSPASRFLWRR